ncbi:hypothetical protein ACFFIX_20290 [Metabacillus herbersteinensis]|uniref:DUF1798 family protein n=1 Tax=Metabacillus herbersteinensis TaxID=283816 RepID=A0ABV6GKR0_9BACI
MISEEEKDIATDYILLGILIEQIEDDLKTFHEAPVKLYEPYNNLLESILKEVRRDLTITKAKMKEQGIKVLSGIPINEDFIEYKYYVRGYNAQFHFFNAALRNYVTKKMGTYLGIPGSY